jgi:two-component system phosphate regulon sensor histidine kinase PhoR
MHNERVQTKDIESAYIESTLLGIQELKRNLVTQIAHNFRTPLTSVIGFAEMLQDDRPLTDEQRVEYARFIQYEGIRLSKLIDDVLELSSLESGDAQLKMRDYVLQEVVADAVARVSDFARGRLVSVKKDFASLPIVIRLDREKIAQAVYQLLHNAIRFTKPNDEVEVTVKVVGESAEIAIRDGGPGFPEEDIPTLFEKVGRVYKPEQDPRGTGVGLAIVKHILDLHNGEIRVQSKVGEGSLFILRIPGIQE